MRIITLISASCCLVFMSHARSVSKPYAPAGLADSEIIFEAAASDMLPKEVLTDHFDMFVPVDVEHEVAESMQYQTFDGFTNSDKVDDMEESLFLPVKTYVRAPQPLTQRERHIRSALEGVDYLKDRESRRYVNEGNIKPKVDAGNNHWEVFDYDSFSGHPGDDPKYIHG